MWVYNDLSKLQQDLLDKKILAITGPVDEKTFSYIREAMLRLEVEGNPAIEVRISSGGGLYRYGLDIYDLIRLYKGKTVGMVIRFAGSMASVILQACQERHAAHNAQILIHHLKVPELTLDDLRNQKKMKKLLCDMEKNQMGIYHIYAKRTGKPVSKIRSLCAKNEPISAKEALRFGLIDKIV